MSRSPRSAENIARHGLDARAFNCALSDRSGEVVLSYYPNLSTWSTLDPDPRRDRAVSATILTNAGVGMHAAELLTHVLFAAPESIRCRAETISRVLRAEEIDSIALLKIDVERSELEVLGGIEDPDWSRVERVVVEAHGREAADAIAPLLRSRGFAVSLDRDTLFEGTGTADVWGVRQ